MGVLTSGRVFLARSTTVSRIGSRYLNCFMRRRQSLSFSADENLRYGGEGIFFFWSTLNQGDETAKKKGSYPRLP